MITFEIKYVIKNCSILLEYIHHSLTVLNNNCKTNKINTCISISLNCLTGELTTLMIILVNLKYCNSGIT